MRQKNRLSRSFVALSFVLAFSNLHAQDVPANIENHLIKWTEFQIQPGAYDIFDGLDINQMIEVLRKPENKVTVLVLPFKPETAQANPELKTDNPPEFRAYLDYYTDPNRDHWSNKLGIAQTQSPFFSGGEIQNWDFNRPGIEEYQIHLGTASNRKTLIHEWTHVLVNRAVFPNPVVLDDGRKMHFHNFVTLTVTKLGQKMRELSAKGRTLENTPGTNAETLKQIELDLNKTYLKYCEWSLMLKFIDISEIVAHFLPVVHSKKLGLRAEDISTSAWLSLEYALELHDFIDDFLKKEPRWEYLGELIKQKQLDQSLLASYDRVLKKYQGVEKELSRYYDKLFPYLMEHDLRLHLARIVRKGRAGFAK